MTTTDLCWLWTVCIDRGRQVLANEIREQLDNRTGRPWSDEEIRARAEGDL